MTLLERIKATIFGVAPPPHARTAYTRDEENRPSLRDDDDKVRSGVSTPADDPVMDDIAAAGTQPVSKPVEIERAQNPRRHDRDRLN